MSIKYFPTNIELENATLVALENLGGEASTTDINKEVINIMDLPIEIVTLEDESGLGTKLEYRLRWIRTNLKTKNKIKNVKRGTWALINKSEH